ncbi:MAG: heavy-metal-associated domain-containing protein [Alkalispirochaetaceae bacterium]
MGFFSKSGSSTVEYTIPNMACGHCEAKVKSVLEGMERVKKVEASSRTKVATIHYEGEAPTIEAVNSALESSGYFAE